MKYKLLVRGKALRGISNVSIPDFASKPKRMRARLTGFKIRLLSRRSGLCALICPPTIPGSFGDEAMVKSLVDQLSKQGFTVDLLVTSIEEDWHSITKLNKKIEYKASAYNLGLTMNLFAEYDSFYLVGADVLDGYYDEALTQWLLWQVWVASVCCPRVTVAGFSFNKKPTRGSIDMFRILPHKVRLCCRDESSLARFNKYVGKPAIATADLAFLLDPDDTHSGITEHVDWINDARSNGGKILGLNISAPSFDSVKIRRSAEIFNLYSREVRKILSADPHISIVLIPHDTRGPNSDDKLLESLFYKFKSGEFKQRVRIVDPPLSAAAIKSLVSNLDAVMSGRMHLAIACMGMATPVACVIYQDKFEGLYRLLRLPKSLTITQKEALKPEAIYKTVTYLLSQKISIHENIKSEQSRVIRLASKNLAPLPSRYPEKPFKKVGPH